VIHLRGPCFARIDDAALTQTFRESQANYDQAVRDLQRLEDYKETTGSQLDQARTRRDMARAAAQRVLAQIEDARICSPVTGIITERMRQQGEYVNPGELIAKVAVMSSIRADLELPEVHYSALKVGDSVPVTLPALKDDSGNSLIRKGRVARKDTLAHPQTHSFTVEIDIENKDLSLPAGTFGTVEVTTYRRESAIVVPLSAIKLNGEEKSLFVLKGSDTVREVKDIEIGQLTQEWAEILGDSIKPGERVVTTGAQWLSDNDTVNPLKDDPKA
jgi:RND family efflux transporter MFP subunit